MFVLIQNIDRNIVKYFQLIYNIFFESRYSCKYKPTVPLDASNCSGSPDAVIFD